MAATLAATNGTLRDIRNVKTSGVIGIYIL